MLQEREFEPLGAERSERVDVRVIAATNRDLQKMMGLGQFHEDLFYRLSVIPIEIPPLRERPEDIPVLVEHFARKHEQRIGIRMEGIDEDALQMLQSYEWPGNVRELENTIERAVVLSTDARVRARELSLSGGAPQPRDGLPSTRLHENVAWAERESILRALERSGGVKKAAAELLGISPRALSHHLRKHCID